MNNKTINIKTINKLFLFSIFFMALWFFGNLYEELVLAPNQIIDAYEKLQHWQHFFTVTNPMFYYVPFTQIAVVVICLLFFFTSDMEQKMLLNRAMVFGIAGIIITIPIVTQLNSKLFFGDLDKYKEQLQLLSIVWLIGNAVRLYLVGSCLYYLLKTYVLFRVQR